VTQDELELKFRDLRSFLRDEIGDMRADLRERVDGVNDRLDVLNGRTRTSELAIAVLNDRSERAEKLAQQASDEASASARLWGGGAGAFVGGVVFTVWKFFGGGHP
jgi:hypothetical protein